jgi:hypothetical protein
MGTQQKLITEPVYGYVLPHAGTEYTAQIITHTLNIRNVNYAQIKRVLIFYYPASAIEDVTDDDSGEKYYHEYYVPWKSINHIFTQANPVMDLEFYGYNINSITKSKIPTPKLGKLGIDTWVVISADFSHFLPMQTAIALENKCAMALQYKKWNWTNVAQGVDDVKTFKYVFGLLSKKILRWVGRTRSPGKTGVGYLSFLIMDNYILNGHERLPDGMFVTCYDTQMNTRECLGKWFNPLQQTTKNFKMVERELTAEVLQLGATTSRLTGGKYLNIPIGNYTVTYLFKSDDNVFNRGWHGVQSTGAFYLPDVFLEDTYETGKWIGPLNNVWPAVRSTRQFNMAPSLASLAAKAGHSEIIEKNKKYILYDCYVKHVKIGKTAGY